MKYEVKKHILCDKSKYIPADADIVASGVRWAGTPHLCVYIISHYETKKKTTVIIMRQPDSCDILPDRDFASRSHNICYETISKYYETAAGNAIL